MAVLKFLSVCLCVLGLAFAQSNSSGTYTNPILNAVGADPWVIRHGGYYYMTYTTATNITILRSSILTDWNNADAKLAFQPPMGKNYSTDL
jgi:beta-xylosidase